MLDEANEMMAVMDALGLALKAPVGTMRVPEGCSVAGPAGRPVVVPGGVRQVMWLAGKFGGCPVLAWFNEDRALETVPLDRPALADLIVRRRGTFGGVPVEVAAGACVTIKRFSDGRRAVFVDPPFGSRAHVGTVRTDGPRA